MTFRLHFQHGSLSYLLGWCDGSVLPLGRKLSDSVAECVLARVLQDADAHELRRAYAELSGSHDLHNISNAAILEWLSARLTGGSIVLLELASAAVETNEGNAKAATRIVQELAAQGISQISYRGAVYRLVSSKAAVGSGYERVEARKAASVLSAMATEQARAPDVRDLLEAARAELGALVLLRKRAALGSPRRAAEMPARRQEPAPPKTTWIEIELLDDSGAPVANQDYLVRLPDGSERRGKLDPKGTAALRGIPPGSCDVSFPGLKPRVVS